MPLALNADGTAPGLTAKELEKVRLLLSTYQDGYGMLRNKRAGSNLTLPGWRDYERVVAVAFNGRAVESKALFDVEIDHPDGTKYGISCKMRNMLNNALKPDGRVMIEVSNAAGELMDCVLAIGRGITAANFRNYPDAAAKALFATIQSWHDEAGTANGGDMTLAKSSYLVLQYNKAGKYKLFQYPLKFPKWRKFKWAFIKGEKRLSGKLADGTLVFEWYPGSGGQFKYQPLTSDALWASDTFELEPLPAKLQESRLIVRAKEYFPDKWQTCTEE